MKKLLSVLLAIIFIFLIGCSSQPTVEPEIEKNEGLKLVNGIDESSYCIISSDYIGNTFYLLASPTSVDEMEESPLYFYIIDAPTNKVINKKELTEKLEIECINTISHDDEGNIYINSEPENKSAKFDSNLNYIGLVDYTYTELSEKYKDNKFYDDYFALYNGFARFSFNYENLGEYFDATIFKDQNDYLYINHEPYNEFLASVDNIALCADFDDNSSITLKVIDYFNSKVICTSNTFKDYISNCCVAPTASLINDKYALVSINSYYDNESSYSRTFIWDYRTGAENRDISIQKLDADSLNSTIDSLCSSLKDNYNINILIDEKIDEDLTPNTYDETTDTTTNGVTLGASKIRTYYILTQLNKFFTYFPNELINEICDEYEDKSGLDIYIVKRINDDNSAAFANIWTDRPMICFSTDEYSFDQMAHEFMHILDIKIINTFERNNDSFWDEWEKYNYDGFYYGTDAEWDGLNYEYFVSAYSMKSQQEDRAEIFQQLFTNSESNDLYKDEPHKQEKANALCEYLRSTYTSLNNFENPIWEKAIKGDA